MLPGGAPSLQATGKQGLSERLWLIPVRLRSLHSLVHSHLPASNLSWSDDECSGQVSRTAVCQRKAPGTTSFSNPTSHDIWHFVLPRQVYDMQRF